MIWKPLITLVDKWAALLDKWAVHPMLFFFIAPLVSLGLIWILLKFSN